MLGIFLTSLLIVPCDNAQIPWLAPNPVISSVVITVPIPFLSMG